MEKKLIELETLVNAAAHLRDRQVVLTRQRLYSNNVIEAPVHKFPAFPPNCGIAQSEESKP